jgi:hypothetical protein
MLFKELERLEEELDFKLMKLNKSQYDEVSIRIKKEKKLYERCIDGLVQIMQYVDVKISKVFNRAWMGYQKVMQKSQKDGKNHIKPCFTSFTNTHVSFRDVAVQVFHDNESNPEEEYDDYINLLNRAIYRIGGMNHDKLIKKLKALLKSLTPIEVPDEPEELQNSFFRSKIESLMNPIPLSLDGNEKITIGRSRLGYIQISRAEQTTAEHSGPPYEVLLSLIKEKDKEMFQMMEDLSRLKNIEIKFEDLKKELEATQRALKFEQQKECKNCLDRFEMAKKDKSTISEMQNSLNKTGKVKEELDITKIKLQQSIQIIGESNKKILILTENLEELQKMYEEAKRQRIKLEERLSEEEKLRSLLENKLKLEQSKTESLSRHQTNMLSFPSEPQDQSDNFLHKFPVKNTSLTRPSAMKHAEEFPLITPSPEPYFLSKTPSREKPRPHLLINESISSSKIRFKRLPKSVNLLSVLKMSKAEFLSLSKKARLELFECLFEHKERCGADCEHLKRAMQIRYKEKGATLTLKKCNIVKT